MHQDIQCFDLQDRLNLAQSIAKSVIFLHNSGIVHKNISPDVIIVFNKEDDSDMGVSALVGFEKFRFQDRKTLLRGDKAWEKNLYRHPTRQGIRPEDAYSMRHDIYSLGVCLLEIGLWTTFVQHNTFGTSTLTSSVMTPGPELKW